MYVRELHQELDQAYEYHDERGDAGEDAEREREGPYTMQNFDLLAAGEAIESTAVSRPDVAEFLDDWHLALLNEYHRSRRKFKPQRSVHRALSKLCDIDIPR